MRRLIFYFQYAFRNVRRGGRWTLLAVFCIAAGVATVVALRGLGLSINETLVSNVREDLKGDVLMTTGNRSQFSMTFDVDDTRAFTDRQIENVQQWTVENDAVMDAWALGGNLQLAEVNTEDASVSRPEFIGTYYIHPQTYPPTHTITAQDPAGIPLSDLFTEGNDIVISANLAENQDLQVGDVVRISGTEDLFTVRGIVDPINEVGLSNPFNAFFGFAYIDIDDARRTIAAEIQPNIIAVKLAEPLLNPDEALSIYDSELARLAGYPRIDTAARQLQRNERISQILSDFIVVLGLGALLIGGVGIMNTMLVMVRRRTTEIAAMKTFGLKGRQVSGIFFAEGVIFGVVGSVAGTIVGILLNGIVNQYGETFLQQPLVWRVYPEAVLYGLVLGMVTTAIFSVAPIMTALQVRPGIILRPNESHAPRMGIIQSLILLAVMIVSVGIVVGQIIRPSVLIVWRSSDAVFGIPTTLLPYIIGTISVAGTLLFLGFLVMVLWVVVWVIGKLPAFRSVDLRLALRNLATYRIRTATTLLALSAGMFALSSITFVGEGTRELLNLQLSRTFGGNILVFPLAPGDFGSSLANFAINNALTDVDVTYRTTASFYRGDLISVDGAALPEIPQATGGNALDTVESEEASTLSQAIEAWRSGIVWDSDNDAVYDNNTIVAGRNLTLADRGQKVLIGPSALAAPLGIGVGSTITYEFDDGGVTYEVVGLYDSGFGLNGIGGVILPPETVPESPAFQLYAFQVEPDNINEALVALSTIRIPPTFSLDVTFLDSLLSRLIDQFAAIPTVVGLLSLLAAAVIMANTVALATLERRRQIGILKSLGLKNYRVLLVMLIETSIIGLLSAVLGIGLSSVFVTIFTGISGVPIPLPVNARLTAALLVLAALIIGWVSTLLSAGPAVRERVMNVLRYE